MEHDKVEGIKKFSDLELPEFEQKDQNGKKIFDGTLVGITSLIGRELEFIDIEEDVASKFKVDKETIAVQLYDPDTKSLYKLLTSNKRIVFYLKYCKENKLFPFLGTIQCKPIKGKAFQDYNIE